MQESGYMKMDHKKKCEKLRKIRVSLADKLGLQDKIKSTPCEFKGECRGTCPACEAEERLLNKALLARTAVIAGTALALTGCGEPQVLSGEVQMVDVEENRASIERTKENREKVRQLNIQDELSGDVELDGLAIVEDELASDEEFLKDYISERTLTEISDIHKYITTQSNYNESEGDLLVTTLDGKTVYIKHDDINKAVKKIERIEDAARSFDVPTEGLAEVPPTFTEDIPAPGNKISGLLEDLFY